MNKRQRILNSLNHIESDIIPYEMGFTMSEFKKMAEYLGDSNFDRKIDNHINYTIWSNKDQELPNQKGYYKDHFGVIWNRSGVDKDIGVIETPIFSEANLSMYEFPTLNKKEIRSNIQQGLRGYEDCYNTGIIGFSLFERAWSMRGFETLLLDMVMNPTFVHDLLDKICDYNIEIIKLHKGFKQLDGFHFGDDWGQQKGLIMGPNMWREFILPRLQRMYKACKDQGYYISQHSCGDIGDVFNDVIDAGLNCYQTFQPEIYDIQKVKDEFGSALTFWGGISTQQLLPFATSDEVTIETKRIMKIMGKDGGYIAAPTHAIPYDVPCENVMAMLKVFENQKSL